MKRFITLVIVVSLLMLTRPLVSFAGCEPNAPPDCSCGKLPVCVFSGHPDGMYSDLYAKSKDPLAWKDFGQDIGDYAMAMEIEDNMIKALAAAYPCLELIATDSYLARIEAATREGNNSGLKDRI